MKYELYINNHNYEKGGIDDYISTIKNIFIKNKIDIKVVKKISLDVDVLLVIENFLDNPKELLEFLLKPEAKAIKLCLVHTEFIDQNFFFNIFDSRDFLFRKILPVEILSDLYKLNKLNYKKILFHIIIIIYLLFGLIIGFNLLDIKKRIAFALRDYRFSKYCHLFNYNLALSDDVYKCLLNSPKIKNVFHLQNYFNTSLIKKFKKKDLNNNLLYLTGAKTPFRKSMIRNLDRRKFNNFIISNKLKISRYNFSKRKSQDFNLLLTNESEIHKLTYTYENKYNVKVNKLELYIAQRKNWPYLSPMRISRAFSNESIPINVGSFRKSNYERLCINIESIEYFMKNYEYIIKAYYANIGENIDKFNAVSNTRFKYFMENIK